MFKSLKANNDLNGKISLDEAKKILPPSFRLPKEFSGYKINDIKILNRATNYFEVSLTYKNGSKEIIIRELNITGNAALSDNYNIGENIQIVDINGYKGIVGTIGNSTSIIKYTDSNIVYVFRSQVRSDELVNIAKSFK